MKKEIKWKRILIYLFISIVLVITAFDQRIKIKTYTIKSDKIKSDSSLRIVLITDLHSTIYGEDQQLLIDKIIAQKPDVILMAGDIADDKVPIKGTKLLLDGIHEIAPIFYVTGNHEYWSRDVEGICKTLSFYGVQILSDKYKEIELSGNVITIAGIEDPDRQKYGWSSYNQEQKLADIWGDIGSNNNFKILLAHRPDRIEQYKKYPYDLVVSGHAHGGQVRIPLFINGLYAPNQGLLPKYAGGLYQQKGLTHIVSRGLSINPILPRVFNPPELVVISLMPEK